MPAVKQPKLTQLQCGKGVWNTNLKTSPQQNEFSSSANQLDLLEKSTFWPSMSLHKSTIQPVAFTNQSVSEPLVVSTIPASQLDVLTGKPQPAVSTSKPQPAVLTGKPPLPAVLTRKPEPTAFTGKVQPAVLTGKPPQSTALTGKLPQQVVLSGKPPQPTVLTGKLPQQVVLTGKPPQSTALTDKLPQQAVLTGKPPQPTVLTSKPQPTVLTSKPQPTEPQSAVLTDKSTSELSVLTKSQPAAPHGTSTFQPAVLSNELNPETRFQAAACSALKLDFPAALLSLLPREYSYHLKTFEEMPKKDFLGAPAECFQAKFYIKLETEEEACQWLIEFQQKSQTTYRILKGSKTRGSLLDFKTVRHCQHYRKYFPADKVPKVGETSVRQKKTDCPSRLIIRVYCKRPKVLRMLPVPDYMCEVEITYNHNHPIHSAHSLSFRDVSEETKAKFYKYFECGHSAASARHEHELHLQLSADSTLAEKLIADRATNPNVQDVSRLFKAWRFQQHGSEHGADMFNCLEEVEVYNKAHSDSGRAAIQRFTGSSSSGGGQPLILAICSPIMYRAHRYIRQSSELVFMDATSSLDRFSCPTYILSTGSAAGAVPLGVFVISNETTSTIADGLNLLKSVMPSDAFFGKGGEAGPSLFLTDELATQREALGKVWPDSRQLLCLFHYLQRWWRWLWEAKQGVNMDDRKDIMQFIRKLVYAETSEDLGRIMSEELESSSSIVTKYPNVLKRVKEMQANKEEWAVAYRSELCMRGKHTNNYSEATVRILKDRVFDRTRAYNLVQLFHFLSTTLELYFEKRLLDIAHNRPSPHLKSPSGELKKVKEPAKLERVSNTVYKFQYVNNPTKCYHVDVELGMCSCPVGICGSPCKHQAFVIQELGFPSVNFVPQYSTEGRRLFAIIALGECNTPDMSFFASIHENQKQQLEVCSNQGECLAGDDVCAEDHLTDDNVEHDDDVVPTSDQGSVDTNNDDTNDIGCELHAVFEDMNERLKENDPNYISGVGKFLKCYRSLQQNVISTPRIASALHTFGTEGQLMLWCMFVLNLTHIMYSHRFAKNT